MKNGADVDQLDQLAATLRTHGLRLRASATELRAHLLNLRWTGGDRIRFDAAAETVLTLCERMLPGRLDELGRRLAEQATAQRRTSAALEIAGQLPLAPTAAPSPSLVGPVDTGSPRTRTARSSETVMLFDSRRGHEVVAVGDVRSARHVAVLVGGIGTALDNFDVQIERARRLHAAAGPNSAVIAWLGYDAPPGFGDVLHLAEAASPAAARRGADALRRFLASLPVAPSADVTVIGHSYGSLVATFAAERSRRIDRLVVVGSPGLGPEHRAELPLPHRTQFFAGAVRSDPITHLQWFGTDPASARFGGVLFDATGPRRPNAGAHAGYFDQGSDSLRNLGRIIRGERPTPARPGPVARILGAAQRRIDAVEFGLALTGGVAHQRSAMLGLAVRGSAAALDLGERLFTPTAGLLEGLDDRFEQWFDGVRSFRAMEFGG